MADKKSEDNYAHINANPMIPHPCDKIFRVITHYNKSGIYKKPLMNLYDAKAEAHRMMNSPHCNMDKVYIICEVDAWEKQMVPTWTKRKR